jgi:hypothetical protein
MIRLIIEERGQDPDTKRGVEVVGNIVLAMRKDLSGKTRLKADDFRYTDVYPEKSPQARSAPRLLNKDIR